MCFLLKTSSFKNISFHIILQAHDRALRLAPSAPAPPPPHASVNAVPSEVITRIRNGPELQALFAADERGIGVLGVGNEGGGARKVGATW